jgi:class 3 adenylate cyclase
MNTFRIEEFQKVLEHESHYNTLLQERHLNAQNYRDSIAAIKAGLIYLGLSPKGTEIFENRDNFIIWLGRRLPEYEGFEIPLYVAHKKMGLPVPEGLLEKCPDPLVDLVEHTDKRVYIQEFDKELKEFSLSSELFMLIHSSLLNARTENLLDGLLADVERFGFTNFAEAIGKIPDVYREYLSSQSLLKVIRKISMCLREVTQKLEQELKNIDLYSLRLKEQLQELYVEADKGLKDIIENDIEKGGDIGEVTQKTSNLFSRLDRLFLGNIYHLKDYEKRWDEIQQLLKQEEEYKYVIEKRELNVRKKIGDIFSEHIFFNKFGLLTREEEKFFVRRLTNEFEQVHRKKGRSSSLLHKFEKRGLLSVGVDFDAIKHAYYTFMKKHIVPFYCGQCLLELVQCFPPGQNEPLRLVRDVANLKIMSLKGATLLEVAEQQKSFPGDLVKSIDMYRRCITILVYDIRGSSYMGIKLHNAVKEQRIKYKFAKEMAGIVKRYGGFLLKDTGDGGLVWFAENSESLYNHLYTESVTGRGIKLRYSIFSGAEFDLIPAADSAKRAILCARDMVQRAEEFIRANFMHYREWFAEVAERTLELDGITYALLPPEFKSLFRIGVGIASGKPLTDVVFSANSYGDPDLVGPIISDAHLYSMERQPGRSVVICDLPSLINMILNIESFEYPTEEDDFDKYIKKVENLRRGHHGYQFPDHKVAITPKGIHYLEELNKAKALKGDEVTEIVVGESNFYNAHKKKLKTVYEIINI